jgi:hypothetical protein
VAAVAISSQRKTVPVKVKLSEIVAELDLQPDRTSAYLDRTSGSIILITDEEFRAAAGEDETLMELYGLDASLVGTARKILADDPPLRYVALPSKSDIHEYRIMEMFCLSVEDDRISKDLLEAIGGKGAFGRFKDRINVHGIAQRWYRFKEAALKEIAVEWCLDNAVDFIEDTRSASADDRLEKIAPSRHHTYPFEPAVWEADGRFIDASGQVSPARGQVRIRHKGAVWVSTGVMRVLREPALEFTSTCTLEPMAPGADTSAWSSENPVLGKCTGTFVLIADTIVSLYRSLDGIHTGTEVLLKVDDDHYVNRGVLLRDGDKVSAWAMDLKRSTGF